MIDPQEYFLASSNPMEEKIAHIFKIYKDELFKANALDFDDLLLETVRLLKSSAEVRERYNRKYKYILIDEYQDTNRPQYELMKLLGKHGNVCVVGDEDQSIYSWRGADIKNILEFEKDFPNTQIIRLEQNYRSTQNILEGASAVVAQNTQRKGKNLWTAREGGSLIGYYEAPDGENEALFIADRINTYLKTAGETEDTLRCAVLYRTNSQSRLVEEALRRYQIQYHMVGGFSFYDRAEVKDMLSYLKLVQNPHDSIALNRVVNSPPRGIGKTTLDTIERIALTTGLSTWDAIARATEEKLLPARALAALSTFRQLILDARAMLGPDFAAALAATANPNTVIDAEPSGEIPAFTDDDIAMAASSEEDEPIIVPNDANAAFDTSFNFDFDFGPSEEISTIAPENATLPELSESLTAGPDEWFLHEASLKRLNELLDRYRERAAKIGTSPPRESHSFVHGLWYRVQITFDPERSGGWKLIAETTFKNGVSKIDFFDKADVPSNLDLSDRSCDHCGVERKRDTIYLLRRNGEYKRVGSTCVEEFTGVSPRLIEYQVAAKRDLESFLTNSAAKTIPAETVRSKPDMESQRGADFNPFTPVPLKQSASDAIRERINRIHAANDPDRKEVAPFRTEGGPATLPELIKFLNDRSGYIRALEDEATPESFSRIENLKELANAAQDATSRGETLSEFLDHAALVSDADSYSAEARVTLMTLHAAKGLEFPLVFLAGMEEGLFPHSRTLTDPPADGRRAPPLLRRHDPRHGHAAAHPRALSPPLRQRRAGVLHALALS